MAIELVNAAGDRPYIETPEPIRFQTMSRETARQKRIRDAYAIERCARPAHVIGSRALYVLAMLILGAAAALLWGAT